MRFAETGPDGFPIEVADSCTHVDHVDHSRDRALLRGNPLDVARWLLSSEGWLHDAWALDQYVAALRASPVPSLPEREWCQDAEGKWHHVRRVEDTVYFDGVEFVRPSPAPQYAGSIDSVKVVPRAMSATEIAAEYNRQSPTPPDVDNFLR